MNKELYTTGFYNDANLVSYWRFEGNSNDSKGSNNGSDTNISYGTSYGKFGQGAYFNGSGKIVLPNVTIPASGTVCLWIKANSTEDGQYLYTLDNNDSPEIRIMFTPTNYITFYYYGGGSYQASPSVGYTDMMAWHHISCIWATNRFEIYLDGILQAIDTLGSITETSTTHHEIGYYSRAGSGSYFNGYIDDLALFNRALSPSEVYNLYNADKSYYHQGKTTDYGSLPSGDDSSISLNTWPRFKRLLERSAEAGKLSNTDVVSTYLLIYTASNAYSGGILDINGNLHFIPQSTTVGQKVDINGIVSTYSLIYTASNAYACGVLAPNGDIHFVPRSANVGQKIDINGVVSTYSLVYTTSGANFGGVLASNGDICFIPLSGNVGQKISSSGVVSTYSLVYTVASAYVGGVLAPNGDIHFIPLNASVGQKVSSSGVVSTYSLVYTISNAYHSAVLALNGDIHFIPLTASVGQKIDVNGVVSTYSLVYTNAGGAYSGGKLTPNGEIHFSPHYAPVGQKISTSGIVSTYSLVYTAGNYTGGVLLPNGDIHFVPRSATVGQKISTQSAIPFSLGTCCSPFFNKF